METEVTTIRDGAAFVEVATVVHNGRRFTNAGASRSPDGEQIFAYVAACDGRYVLTTWSGETIAPLALVSHWRRRAWSHVSGFNAYAWRATIDGATYHGRNGGTGLLLVMRRSRRAGASS